MEKFMMYMKPQIVVAMYGTVLVEMNGLRVRHPGSITNQDNEGWVNQLVYPFLKGAKYEIQL